MKNLQKIEITPKSVLIIIGICLALFVAWEIKAILFMFFFSFIISSALRPLVESLHERGLPRLVSILIIYVGFTLFVGFITYILGVTVIEQVQRLSDNSGKIITDVLVRVFETFPWLKNIFNIESVDSVRKEVEEFLSFENTQFLTGSLFTSSTGRAIINVLSNLAGILLGVFTVFVLSAYMLQREDKFYNGLLQVLDNKERKNAQKIINKVEHKLGSWLIGQIALMIAVGITTYLGLLIPGVFFPDNVFTQYAIPMALIAGILEALPNLGPILTWVVAIVITVGSGGSIVEVGYVASLFIAIQQLEAVLLVPMVMKKAIGIDPIIVILGILAASSLFGIIGAILVLPLIAIFQIAFDEIVVPKQVS